VIVLTKLVICKFNNTLAKYYVQYTDISRGVEFKKLTRETSVSDIKLFWLFVFQIAVFLLGVY